MKDVPSCDKQWGGAWSLRTIDFRMGILSQDKQGFCSVGELPEVKHSIRVGFDAGREPQSACRGAVLLAKHAAIKLAANDTHYALAA
jgi:hypothetical protein